jgi:hypothetical protein
MFLAFFLFLVALVLSLQTDNSSYFGATDIEPDRLKQEWNWDAQYRCRLFSHQSRFSSPHHERHSSTNETDSRLQALC